jgi:hypothetical protein
VYIKLCLEKINGRDYMGYIVIDAASNNDRNLKEDEMGRACNTNGGEEECI